MRSAAQAYKNVSRQTSSPRELEASLLLQAAARLQAVQENWDSDNGARAKLDDALLYNRKLWSVFVGDMADASHPMPRELRQNFLNIGLFVMNHTVTVMSNPQPERLGSLININREIAAGLLGRA
ncbi:flagellar biosynthesis regulator FlaF [Rhodoplanes sp. Z2-YC6860]|uniref:flagellar biosynthesis regulator FlaF n=1 Tax=Rhodoplanes sp. Z2-YC6860 TaxID=674703 RepID=UPI00078DDFD8|nr:flagellar biosynthesis regulator FlaF [Rhodoplanes sp. Z2-YC6860]AMN43318.1 flagellar biosynthesis regulatory protein FlaF [Rhodoplanes sp. Z2-YC6860]